MDYEKEYKEALERAREYHKVDKDNTLKLYAKGTMEYIFPELKESGDERIRKVVTLIIKGIRANVFEEKGISKEDTIAWLEKQGEQKPVDFKAKDWYVSKVDGKIHNMTYNPTDKVEPKFKVGDWITDGYLYYKITDVLEDRYIVDRKFAKERCAILFKFEHYYHLWTLKDAKDGDVLQLGKVTAIFKEYSGDETCICYCSVCEGEFEIPADDGVDNVYGCYDTYPATKEQRDLLFQKMKEAGYEWNAEKKELKKIHVIDEGKSEMDYCFTKMMNGEKVSSAWSEEDERMCNASVRACQYMVENFENSTWDYEDAIDWLKSLKDRYSWKPSKEQMKGIDCAIKTLRHQLNVEDKNLNSLYEQLKNL